MVEVGGEGFSPDGDFDRSGSPLGDTELRVFTEGTTVPTGAITLNNVENDFRGDLSASGQNMTLADANDLALRDFRVTGVLTIQTGGN